MKMINYVTRGLAAVFVGWLAISSGLAPAADGTDPSSGFLDAAVESKMTEVKVSDGGNVMRWTDPALTRANYSAVMVDRVIFYPAPSPGPQVSSKTLEQIADYLTEALRRELGNDLKVVDKAGAGVLRMQPAITAVVVKEQGLSVKDVVPVHLLFTAVKSAAGEQAEKVSAAVEVRITDSMSGDYRAAARRQIKGKKLEGEKDQLTLDDFKKALDEGVVAGAAGLREALGN